MTRSPKKDWISAMLACEVWDVAPSCWKYPIESSSSSSPTLHTPAWPKFSPFSATASFRRDFGHRARPIWRCLIISYRDIWKGNLPKQTTNHTRLENKHHRRNLGSDSGRTGKDFPKYGAPGSILSGRKWWPLPAHIVMSSHFLHNEVSPLQISLQYPH